MPRPGEADFKSNVLSRDEKGVLGIPMKRLISCAMGAAGLYMVGKMVLGEIGIVLGVVGFIALIILTAPKGGLPYWQRLMYGFRGSLIGEMIDHPDSLAASIGKYLKLEADTVQLDGDLLFAAVTNDGEEEDWSDWTLYADPQQAKADDGLVIVERPKPHIPARTAPAALGSGKP